MPPLRGFPWNFFNGGRVRKTRTMPLPDVKKCDDMSIGFDTVPALDRLDRQTEKIGKTISRSACIDMLTRDKNILLKSYFSLQSTIST